ncbi:DNA excision repair protein [Cryptosporidium felis]|nr:DNA excision repair protein [Cryptosporidium felis]
MDVTKILIKEEKSCKPTEDEDKNVSIIEKNNSKESLREDSRSEIVSFYESQNLLECYFNNSEAQSLRDLGVSLVNAKDVSSTIFEQVKSHFNKSSRSLEKQNSCSGSHSKYSNENSGLEADGILESTIVGAIHKPGEDFDPNQREDNSELIEDDIFEQAPELEANFGSFEVRDDIDFDRYSHRVSSSSSRRFVENNEVIPVSSNSGDGTRLYIWSKIWKALYPHQKEGVLWMWGLYCNNHGGILADEMGLGKSVTVAAFIAALFVTFSKNTSFGSGSDEKVIWKTIKTEVVGESEKKAKVRGSGVKGELDMNVIGNLVGSSEGKIIPEDLPASLKEEVNSIGKVVSDKESLICKTILLVVPATLISHWIEIFNKWYYPLRVILFHGKGDSSRICIFDEIKKAEGTSKELLVITTYETLRRNLSLLKQINWFYVILDEGHKIRNPDSGITLAVKSLGTCNRLLLSGSPIQNDLRELWSLIDFVCPGRLGTLPIFEEQFVLPIKQSELKNAAKVQTMRALNCTRILQELIGACILRRRKHELQDILKLPSQAEHVLFCTLTPVQYDVYCSCLDLLQADQLIKNKMFGISKYFALLNILREVCNHPELLKFIRTQNKDGIFDSDVDLFEEEKEEELKERITERKKRRAEEKSFIADEKSSEEGDERLLTDLETSKSDIDNDLYMEREHITLKRGILDGRDSGKYQALLSILKLWRDKKEHRVLIFTQGVRTLKLLLVLLERDLGLRQEKDVLTLDGSTPLNTRFSLVKRFNQDQSIFLFILTSRVGGVGLNIVGANRVILYDPWWNPMTDVQAKERCWRIGQKKEVIVYRLITRDTIEEKIFQRQLFKEFIAKQILKDPKSRSSLNWTNFTELVRKPNKPKNHTSNPEKVSRYIRNVKNIWGNKAKHYRRDGNTYSRYFDERQPPDERSCSSRSKREMVNDELNLFGEITCDAKSEHNAIMSILGDSSDCNLISKDMGSSITPNPCNQNSDYSEYCSGNQLDIAEAADEITKTSIKLIKQSEIERNNYNFDVPTWTGKSGKAGAPSSFILRNLRRQEVALEKGVKEVEGAWDEDQIRRRLREYFLKRERLGIATSTEDLLSSFGDFIPESSYDSFKRILREICKLNKNSSSSGTKGHWVLRRE